MHVAFTKLCEVVKCIYTVHSIIQNLEIIQHLYHKDNVRTMNMYEIKPCLIFRGMVIATVSGSTHILLLKDPLQGSLSFLFFHWHWFYGVCTL